MANKYQEEVKAKTTLRLRQQLKLLPPFLSEFFRGITENTSARTRIGYAYDLKIFFTFLTEECDDFPKKQPTELTMDDLRLITADHIEGFMEYLSYYIKERDGQTMELQNEERGKSRKLSAVRTMFSYFFKKRKIESNPSELVDFPKIHDKTITLLEINEVANLLDEVESGEHLTERQKKFHQYTSVRDLAIVTLLLGTGMRVSECVGIDIAHVDFNTRGIKITRKGGNESIIYFGEEVNDALERYLIERLKITPKEGNEDAFFLSLQNRRITDRSIQLLVKKYSLLVTSMKNISPHKLRSTYGTHLYRETRDIYLVADVLGHADVNTTKRHYAQMDDDRRRKAANYVKLRKD